MSAEEPRLSVASRCMETTTLHVWPRDEGEEEEDRDEEHYKETKEPLRNSSDDSEESEAEPPPASAVRRKVSFADAFGLDLVSVKEFDSRSETGPKNLDRLLGAEAREGEEYYLTCLFTVPSSEEELLSLLQQTKLVVESIELLPGSTTIWGIIRVLNLAYHKTIYVHTTLDGWQSHFDLLAEYLPGSSDGQTDRFTFRLILVPPIPVEGIRVEFCLRYESNNRTFWSSNGGMNYVLFCHHRGRRELRECDGEKERETEESSHKGKKSCLKASRKWSNADLNSKGMSSDLSEPESCRSEESAKEKIQQKAESTSSQAPEEVSKTLVDRRNRRRAARLARVQDYFSQREPEVQLGYHLHRETKEGCLKLAMPASQLSTPMDTPPIVTHHQIPLLSLDWRKPTDPPSHPHTAEISGGNSLDVPEKQLTEEDSIVSCNDAWKAFLSGTGTSDTHANVVDKGCLLHITSLPSHTECDTSIPGEKMLSESWKDTGPSNTTENTLAYKLAEKQGITSKNCNVQELALVQTQVGSSEITGEDMSLLKISQHLDTSESQKSRERHRVAHEKCEAKGGSFGTEEEVKGDINEVVHNTLTFRGIRDEPFTIGHMGTEGPLERLTSTDKEKELKPVTKDISEKNENAAQMKVKSSRTKLTMQVDSEESFQLGNPNAENISISDSEILGKEELDSTDRTFSKRQEKEQAMCNNSDNEMAEDLPSVDLSTTSYASDTSGPFSPTESVRESEPLIFPDPHKGLEFGKTLPRQDAAQTKADTSCESIVELDCVKEGLIENPFHLEDTDIISMSESTLLHEEELDARSGLSDREALNPKGKGEAMNPKPENERLVAMAREMPSIVVDNDRADVESKVNLTINLTTQHEPNEAEDVILGKKSKGDTCKGFIIGQELHKTHRSTDLCTDTPTLFISSHTSNTSGSTECISDIEPLFFSETQKGLECKENLLRQNVVEVKMTTSWSMSYEEPIERLESGRQKVNKKKVQLEDQNTEMILMCKSMVLEEEKVNACIELSDREALESQGKEEAAFYNYESERFTEMKGEIASTVVDYNVADRKSEVSSKTNVTTQKQTYEADEVILGIESKIDTFQDFIIDQEPHKTHRTADLCMASPTLYMTSHICDTSVSFRSIESVKDTEPSLFSHKGFEFEKTLPRQDAVEMKEKTSWSMFSEQSIAGLENGKEKGNGEPFQLEDQNSEIISIGESMVLDEEELDTRTEWTDREASKPEGKEEITSHISENKRLMEMAEETQSVAVDINEAERDVTDISSTTNMTTQTEPDEADEVTLERKRKSDTCQIFITGKEPHYTHRTTDLCTGSLTLSTSSHASNTSGPPASTECVSDSETLLFSDPQKDFEFEETLPRQDAVEISLITSLNESSEEITMGLESRQLRGYEEPFHLEDKNTEIISMNEGMVLDEEELDAETKWSDWKAANLDEQEEPTCQNPENERLTEMAEEIPSVVVENNRPNRESEVSSTTNLTTQKEQYEGDEVILGCRESTVGLESGKQKGNKDSFHVEDQNAEIISMSESMVLNEDELDARTEWSDREASKPDGKEEEMCPNPENERLMDTTEKIVAVDISVTGISSTTKATDQKEPYGADEAMLRSKSTSDTCKDNSSVQEPQKPHRTIDICACTVTLSITSHSSDTDSVKDCEPLLFSDPHRGSECGETLRDPAAQDLQEPQDPGSEVPAPLTSMPTPAVCTVSSRLMTWWAEFCSLGHLSKALLYTILFVIFITVYLHDLPIFLAIYLLSMCWWCGQGIKKQETTDDSVD